MLDHCRLSHTIEARSTSRLCESYNSLLNALQTGVEKKEAVECITARKNIDEFVTGGVVAVVGLHSEDMDVRSRYEENE